MTLTDFLTRLSLALFCGLLIRAERQWRQRTAGLRTYMLVSVGSALFVMVSCLTPNESSPTRVASQIVTGVGFLGAGVIMHSGLTIRGLNTAGTIWCSSAVGTLAGSGYLTQSAIGAFVVLLINTLFYPLVGVINRQPVDPREQEVNYALQLTFHGTPESSLRGLLVQLVGVSSLTLHQLESVKGAGDNHLIKAVLSSPERHDGELEQLASRLCLEKNVVGLNWQLLPHGKVE